VKLTWARAACSHPALTGVSRAHCVRRSRRCVGGRPAVRAPRGPGREKFAADRPQEHSPEPSCVSRCRRLPLSLPPTRKTSASDDLQPDPVMLRGGVKLVPEVATRRPVVRLDVPCLRGALFREGARPCVAHAPVIRLLDWCGGWLGVRHGSSIRAGARTLRRGSASTVHSSYAPRNRGRTRGGWRAGRPGGCRSQGVRRPVEFWVPCM
jgi:hypothetical protein